MRSTTLLLFTILASSILPGFPLPVSKVTLQSRGDPPHLQALAAAALGAIPGNSGPSDKKRPLDSPGGEPETKKQATGSFSGPVVTFLNVHGEENTVGRPVEPGDSESEKLTNTIFGEVLHELVRPTSVRFVGSYKKRTQRTRKSDRNWNIVKIQWPGHPEGPEWFGWLATGTDFTIGRGAGRHRDDATRTTLQQSGMRDYIGIMRGSPARNGFVAAGALAGEFESTNPSITRQIMTSVIVDKRKEEFTKLGGEFNAMFMVSAGPPAQAHT